MQTSGRGNDALMILVPVGALVIAGTISFGGPREMFEGVNAIVGEVLRAAMEMVSALV
jgi:hypothetical protein